MKVCVVSSCGGHLTEARMLLPAFSKYSHFYVINNDTSLSPDMENCTYFITHSERDWKFFLNLLEAFRIIRSERPDLILSTGAGPAVPFALVGRFLFGCKVVFVETLTCIERPSMTGKIMYRLAHDFFYQWPELKSYFPKGQYGGSLLKRRAS
ncbi:MAG: PssD/Cps14F family polysaccharide biosynthesis glycosyltransferase [Sedimenticola sp.]